MSPKRSSSSTVPAPRDPEQAVSRRGIAIITDCAGIGGAASAALRAAGIGVDVVLSTEAAGSQGASLARCAADAMLHTIICSLEGLADGRAWLQAAERAIVAGKHVVVLAIGTSEAASRLIARHTGRTPTAPDVYRGVFGQLGIVQAWSLTDLVASVVLLEALRQSGRAIGERGTVGIVCGSGGIGALLTDHVVDAGLEVPELEATAAARCAEVASMSTNPIVLPGGEQFAETLARMGPLLEADCGIDTWLIADDSIAKDAASLTAVASGINARGGFVIGCSLEAGRAASFANPGVPIFANPSVVITALAALVRARNRVRALRDWADFPQRRAEEADLDVRLGAKWTVGIRQDREFGPVLTMHHGDTAGLRDARRVVRALPITDEELRSAADEADDGWAGTALVTSAQALMRRYREDQRIAEIVVELGSGDVRISLVAE